MGHSTEELDKAANYLNDGRVIAHATEAIFGFDKLWTMKRVSEFGKLKTDLLKKFIVIFSSIDEVVNIPLLILKMNKKFKRLGWSHYMGS